MNDIFSLILKRRKAFLSVEQDCIRVSESNSGFFSIIDSLVSRLDQKSALILADFENQMLFFKNETQKKDVEHILIRYQNLLLLSQVYSIPQSVYFKNDDVLQKIQTALNFLYDTIYNLQSIEHTNWWQWEIGFPLLIHDILVLLNGETGFNEHFIKKITDVTRYFQSDASFSGNNPVAYHPSGKPLRITTGANRIDTIKVSLIRGALTKNAQEIDYALSLVNSVLVTKHYNPAEKGEERDGFYQDGSFIQHADIPYTGTYGNVLLGGIAEIIHAVSGTQFENIINIDAVYNHVFASFEPLLFCGAITDSVNGRSITRNSSDHTHAHRILNSFLLLTQGDHEQKTRLQSIIKRELKRDTVYDHLKNEDSLFFSVAAHNLLTNQSIQEIPYQNKTFFFNTMERYVKRTDSYAIVLALHSQKIGNYESLNGENTRGWFTGDGMIYIYDRPDNYIDFWRNADMYYIAGTTEIMQNMENKNAQRNALGKTASGNPSYIDKNNTIHMDFYNWNDTLHTKKEYSFTQNGLHICEKIISAQGDVYTTLEQKKVCDINSIYVDGQKIEANTMPYIKKGVFSHIQVDGRTFTINTPKNTVIKITNCGGIPFFILYVEHEKNAQNIFFDWNILCE